MIEIISADAMAELSERCAKRLELEREVKKEIENFVKYEKIKKELTEKIPMIVGKIQQSAEQGCKSVEIIVKDGKWGGPKEWVHWADTIPEIINIFEQAGYTLRWHEYCDSWQYKSEKTGYLYISWKD